MDQLNKLLKDFRDGKTEMVQILEYLNNVPFENLSFAHVDHHRVLRQGFPEVIYCEGKELKQIIKIAGVILKRGSTLLATRADRRIYDQLKKNYKTVKFNAAGRIVYTEPTEKYKGMEEKLLIITAGTTDIPVAEEAYQTVYSMGFGATKIFDVGVAGIHRLFNYKEKLTDAEVIIVVAGMEGALASVVGGLVAVPVIAVPTSGGYGTSFGGVTALLAMLNSCASGVTVVNIDNGFGAGFAAARILRGRINPRDEGLKPDHGSVSGRKRS
jgi:NCAIR mutase (PurE)-related protein